MNREPRIVCAALRYNGDGAIVTGPRHFDATMHAQIAAWNDKDWHKAEQGFIDQYGCFHNRKESWAIAVQASQIRNRIDTAAKDTLFSEHLY